MRKRILWLMVPFLLAAGAPAGAVQYYVTTAANAGGTVTPKKGKIPVVEGGTQDVTFKAYTSYYLKEVKVNKVSVPLTNRKTFTKQFAYEPKNQTIAARFARDPFVVAGFNAGGTIEPKGKVFVPYSTSQTFSFKPNTGFHISNVLVDGVGLPAPAVVGWEYPTSWTFDNVEKNHSLKVLFTINTYIVALEPSSGGNITPAMSTAKHGQTKLFTVTPVKGMKIKSVTVNGVRVTDLPGTKPIPDSGIYQFPLTITENVTVAAEFAEIVAPGTQRLKGTYHVVSRESSFWKSAWGGTTSVSEHLYGNNVIAKFDGQGGCSVSITGTGYSKQMDGSGNETVNVQSEPENFNCTYTVNDTNGTFTINIGTTETVTGWVSPDGNNVVLGGPQQWNEEGGTGYSVDEAIGVRAGTTMTIGSLKGKYNLVSQEASLWKSTWGSETHVSDNIWASNITAEFDGNGKCSVTVSGEGYHTEMDGSGNQIVKVETDPPQSLANCSYTVTPAGLFTVTLTTPEGTESHSGWVSADGNSVVMGGPSQKNDTGGTGYSTELIAGVKAGANMDISSLSGAYHLVNTQLSYWQSPGGVSGGMDGGQIDATFDGNGGCSVSNSGSGFSQGYDGNGNETVNIYTDPIQTLSDCTYTIDSDGKFTVTLVTPDGAESHSGRISADGNSVVMGGSSQKIDDGGTGYSAELLFGVKVQAQ